MLERHFTIGYDELSNRSWVLKYKENDMELRVLKYFLVVADEGNITVAANRLHMTQPTLSRQLHDLESELGQKLFVRKSHNIILTQEGIILRKRAEEIVALSDKTEREFKAMKNDMRGEVYIGSGETEAMDYIASACSSVYKTFPGIRYHLYSGNAMDIIERLDKGLLDFGLLIHHRDIAKYDYVELPVKDVFGVFTRRDSELAKKPCVTLDDIAAEPLIFSKQALEEKYEINDIAKWFGYAWNKLNIISTFNLRCNAAALARQGIGHIVSTGGRVDISGDRELCFREFEPKLEVGIVLVWKKDKVLSGAAELFLKRLKEII